MEWDALFETVAQEVFVHYERLWKPGALKANRIHLERQMLPCFAPRMISAITRQDVAAWFGSRHAMPRRQNDLRRSFPSSCRRPTHGAAGRRTATPVRCRETGRERFLLLDEYRSLAAVLARQQSRHPLHAAPVKLLLLAGRKSKIIMLRWTEEQR